MSLVDYKNRKMEIGDRVCIQEDIPTVNGMLYENTICKIDDFNNNTKKIRVTDRAGKVWWVESSQISCSFL